MFLYHLKTAFRNIIRHRSHSIINITGLTIGIAVFFMIMMFIRHELSYDKHLSNYKRIYKISRENVSVLAAPFAPLIQENIPEIENYSRYFMFLINNQLISYNEKSVLINNCSCVDSTFTSIFSFPIILGDHKSPLKELNSIVLTESVAKKIFGNENPIGKIVNFGNSHNLKVTAVLKDLPENNSFQFSALIPILNLKRFGNKMDDWSQNNYETYFLVKKGVKKTELQDKINHFFQNYSQAQFEGKNIYNKLYLHNLQELYFNQNLQFDRSKHGNYYFVQIFFIIGIVVLLIAIINFINLSSAKASIRAKEIGIKKVLGSYRSKLIWLLLTESILLSLCATFLALILVELLKPFLLKITGIHLNIGYLENPFVILIIVAFSITLGIVLGIFPALVMSSIKIIHLFKNLSIGGKGGKYSRAILIVIQFIISITLIISTIVILRQLHFLKNKDLGYKKENIVFMNLGQNINGSLISFKNELLNNSLISSVTFSSGIPGKILTHHGRKFEDKSIQFFALIADPDYLDLMGMKLLEGRNFSDEIETDPNYTIIFNETAIKENQIENPIGKSFWLYNNDVKIIGIVKDFHFKSLHHNIEPLALIFAPDRYSYINIKLASKNNHEAISHIENIWNKFYPEYPFNYQFMDEFQNSLYYKENNFINILLYFTLFAIFISCLGLYGLVSFITERRSKEIGIRKVYGASIFKVSFLITKDITKWIGLAFIIACPLGYWFAKQWLANFSFQTYISWWIYAITGILALLIGWITLSVEAYKAAVKNPVDAIKYE